MNSFREKRSHYNFTFWGFSLKIPTFKKLNTSVKIQTMTLPLQWLFVCDCIR
ncbi:hypothetical protein CCYN2B_50083 [Capnocytophaga cynodegmi]|uniref:Uncharacterized protein n=1 Tax=Capnocytophaga cynodegmi TaxID=28189 RepID=A0A0B7HIW9_9FLAO|nr:hypothetical protein CCYN49044_180010 [Capnocytophaga cynodegmi]CEN38567.1 hypothetical protein CCYN2B_50083 [Capnocytophaga cynodegmi]CEN38594.1 hypothetical protein CCYN74_30203 [Capnocytophaga cynodegmi]